MLSLRGARRYWAALCLLGLCLSGCGEPCERLLETVCEERPREELCALYRERVDRGDMSPELCSAVREVFLEQLERQMAK